MHRFFAEKGYNFVKQYAYFFYYYIPNTCLRFMLSCFLIILWKNVIFVYLKEKTQQKA